MLKVILLFISFSTFAAISENKVDYLINLLKVETRFPSLVSQMMDNKIIEQKELALVQSEYQKHLSTHKKWTNYKDIVSKFLATKFTTTELNQLIAIHELPVMKKISNEFNTLDKLIINSLATTKGKTEENEYRVLLKRAQLKYGKKVELFKKIRAKKK